MINCKYFIDSNGASDRDGKRFLQQLIRQQQHELLWMRLNRQQHNLHDEDGKRFFDHFCKLWEKHHRQGQPKRFNNFEKFKLRGEWTKLELWQNLSHLCQTFRSPPIIKKVSCSSATQEQILTRAFIRCASPSKLKIHWREVSRNFTPSSS